jgi:hypothetical protein
MIVPTILVAIVLANLIYDLTGFIIKCFDRTKMEKGIEKMNNRSYVQTLREMEDYATYITRKHNNQIVYKVDGDFNGDIKGDNVTVILMGNGDFNGNIESQDGNVVLIKGNINGDVKANKIVCPTEPTTYYKDQYICKEEYDDTPPEEIIEYVHNHKLATKYGTCPIVHIKCPNCGKHFAKQLRVQTTILDGVIVGTNVEEMRHDY